MGSAEVSIKPASDEETRAPAKDAFEAVLGSIGEG